jgi:hypothetical protein
LPEVASGGRRRTDGPCGFVPAVNRRGTALPCAARGPVAARSRPRFWTALQGPSRPWAAGRTPGGPRSSQREGQGRAAVRPDEGHPRSASWAVPRHVRPRADGPSRAGQGQTRRRTYLSALATRTAPQPKRPAIRWRASCDCRNAACTGRSSALAFR